MGGARNSKSSQKKRRQPAAKTVAETTAKSKKLTPKQRAKLQHVEERRTLVSQFNLSGASLRNIAQLVTTKGYPCTHETVREDLEAIFAEEKAMQFADVETLRILGNQRLNAMFLAFWTKTLKGDLQTGWLSLAIFTRWCEMNAVDKPKQVDVKVNANELLAKFLGCSPDELPDVI